jgi:hypothetical protein
MIIMRPLKPPTGCCTFAGERRVAAPEYWYGVLDHDNVPRRPFEEFKREGHELRTTGQRFSDRRSIPRSPLSKTSSRMVFDHQYLTREVDVASSFTALFQAASDSLEHRFRRP